MTIQNPYAIQVPPVELLGKAMLALNERQRAFVCALAIYGGEQSEAYRAAGYNVTNDNSAGAAASRLANSDAVIAAIQEEALRRMNSSTLLAVSTLMELASAKNDDKKTRKAAADSLLDRVRGFAGKSEHTQNIVHHLDEKTADELIDFIRITAKTNGLDATKLLGHHAPVIDAEFEEVPMSSEGLEDVL